MLSVDRLVKWRITSGSATSGSGGGLAAANSTITNSNPEGGSANAISDQPVAGGVGNVVAVTPSAGSNSFAYAVTTADGPNNAAAAYAAIGASDGGTLASDQTTITWQLGSTRRRGTTTCRGDMAPAAVSARKGW